VIRALRTGAVAAVAALLAPLGFAVPAYAQTQHSNPVSIIVESVTPATPVPTTKPSPITFTLTVTNTTATPLRRVRIVGERGDPIGNQVSLDKSLADSGPPTSGGLSIPSRPALTVDLPSESSRTVSFQSTTSTIDHLDGICLCHQAVYPLFFSAHITGAGGVDQVLGVAVTYLPAFYARTAPVRVSWVWPLVDQPHRLADRTVFTDDLLVNEVSGPDGRLYRALQVVQEVGGSIPLTVVIDPDLLDELKVMATGKYTVQQSNGHTVPGTGQQAATAWLDQLRSILTNDPKVQVELTPYGDPDVASLNRHGLSWDEQLPADMTANVSDALANRPLDSSVAWPAAGAINRSTLQRLTSRGVDTVVLDGSAVTPRSDVKGVPAGLARLEADHRDIAAALTSGTIEKDAADVLTLGGPGPRSLPALLAELAVRAAQEPDAEHPVVITPPRYVDPSVTGAVQAITETSRSVFATPSALQSIVSGELLPTGTSRLATVPRSATKLPQTAIAAARLTESMAPAIASLLDRRVDRSARVFVDSLPFAVQRVESSAWREENAAKAGRQFATDLTAMVDGITNGVKIVPPRPSGSYTLTSGTSPLPITVENDLTYAVRVRVQVNTVNGLPGLTTRDIGVQRIEARGKAVLHLPTSITRPGRIQVDAQLLTPNRVPLGQGVQLTVHSTVLGLVGVIITVVAGVVLALALLVRLLRRVHRRNGRNPSAAQEPEYEPEPIA
jgi:hypothetical protein